MLECGQPKTHQIQSHGGEPRGLSIISTSKKQRKFFGIHHRISGVEPVAETIPSRKAVVMRGISRPLSVAVRSRRLLASGLGLLNPTWACKLLAKAKTTNNTTSFFILDWS